MAIRSSSASVEIPRREACVRCALPVFFVERVVVGKQLYHAECFRCVRCLQPMSAGNFYEMEEGGYCCETCPDEERDVSSVAAVPLRSALERSLSDEEKSFRTVPETSSSSTPFTTALSGGNSMARSHFMQDLIATPVDSDSCPPTTDTLNSSASSVNVNVSAERTVNICDRGGLAAMDDSVDSTKEDRRNDTADVSVIVISDSDVNATQSPEPESVSSQDDTFNSTPNQRKRSMKLPRWPPISAVEEASVPVTQPSVPVAVPKSPQEAKETVERTIGTVDSADSTNPFDDDDMDDVGDPSASSTRLDQSQSLNPFSDEEDDADDDDVGDVGDKKLDHLKGKLLKKEEGTAASSRVSLNPFSSDEDDAAEEVKVDKPLKKLHPRKSDYCWPSSTGDTPEEYKMVYKRESILPTQKWYDTPDYRKQPPPRISLNPFSSDEEDDTSMSSTAQKRLSYGSTNSLASTASSSITSTYRKKKPAPKPPIPEFAARANSTGSSPHASVASSPSTSAQHSPKPRKAKRAPLPPTSTPEGTWPVPAPRLINLSTIQKVAKDEANRQTQSSQFLLPTRDKSTYGKWKRKKGQAPGLPVPQKRAIKALPMTELKKELDIIDVQLQGLSKQGVRLEKIIRDQCEGPDADPTAAIPIEAEDLILQLFEVVNEKNELCRRQSELMYLKRQHRLEEEQAEIEYEVRCLMLQICKTDSEKARETTLVERLVEVVNMRAEIVECLEMDRVRRVEEDDSISTSMNMYASKRDGVVQPPPSPAKKEKKKRFRKLLKFKKLTASKLDADKDVDESETQQSSSKSVVSKKKK